MVSKSLNTSTGRYSLLVVVTRYEPDGKVFHSRSPWNAWWKSVCVWKHMLRSLSRCRPHFPTNIEEHHPLSLELIHDDRPSLACWWACCRASWTCSCFHCCWKCTTFTFIYFGWLRSYGLTYTPFRHAPSSMNRSDNSGGTSSFTILYTTRT